MIRIFVFLFLVLLFFCGLTTGDYDEEYNYYDDNDSNLVPQKKVLGNVDLNLLLYIFLFKD